MTPVRRLITCFDKRTGRLVKEISFSGISLQRLQEIFDEPAEDLMYEAYRLNAETAQLLQPYATEAIDIKSYNCFLDCYEEP